MAILSCEKMDSSYEEFIVAGGLDYPGKVVSAEAHPGKNRVELTWIPSSDPNVEKTKVFWNNYQDSLLVDLPETSTRDTLHLIIDNLPEKSSYSFILKTYNFQGNESVPVELITRVYGESYQGSIRNRPILKSMIEGSPEVVSIYWEEANITDGAYAVDVKYTDTLDMSKIVTVPVSEDITIINDMKGGTTYEYRTLYIPESSIDNFETTYKQNDIYYLSQSDWSVIDFSTQHPGDENKVDNVIDGDPGTRWHTYAGQSSYPHFVTVDMGAEHTLSNFEIFRMKDDDRAADIFKLWSSLDNIEWTDLGEFNLDRFSDEAQIYNIPSAPKARYFKYEGISGPQDYMVTGEIGVKYLETIPD